MTALSKPREPKNVSREIITCTVQGSHSETWSYKQWEHRTKWTIHEDELKQKWNCSDYTIVQKITDYGRYITVFVCEQVSVCVCLCVCVLMCVCLWRLNCPLFPSCGLCSIWSHSTFGNFLICCFVKVLGWGLAIISGVAVLLRIPEVLLVCDGWRCWLFAMFCSNSPAVPSVDFVELSPFRHLGEMLLPIVIAILHIPKNCL